MLALVLAIATAAAPCAEAPFRWTPGQIEIEVSVNGRAPLWFILDSGAELSILRTDLADAAGRTNVQLGIGGFTFTAPQVLVMPLDNFRQQHRDIRGVIGYDFFAARVVTIDYERRIVRHCPAAGFQAAPDDVAIPLAFAGRLPVVAATLTLADGRELPLRAMVDTGAQLPLIVRHPFADAHGLLRKATQAAPSPSLYGPQAMQWIATRSVRLGPVALDVASVKVFAASAGSGGFTATDALLGNELLRRARVTFDYARRRLLLAPIAPRTAARTRPAPAARSSPRTGSAPARRRARLRRTGCARTTSA
jgi:Aspartyl protease